MPLSDLSPAFEFFDAAIQHEVLRLRARYELSQDEFHGLYISDRQVDALLASRSEAAHFHVVQHELNRLFPIAIETLRKTDRWDRVISLHDLTKVEILAVFFAFATEVMPKYAPLIAYLNDNVQRRNLTPELILRLLGLAPDDQARLALTGQGGLVQAGILTKTLAQNGMTEPVIKLSRVAKEFLIGAPPEALVSSKLAKVGLASMDEHMLPLAETAVLELRKAQKILSIMPVAVIAPDGSHKISIARQRLCPPDCPVFEVHGGAVARLGSDAAEIRQIGLAARLVEGRVIVRITDNANKQQETSLVTALSLARVPVIVLCASLDFLNAKTLSAHHVILKPSTVAIRLAQWRHFLSVFNLKADDNCLANVSEFFDLNAAEIESAVRALSVTHSASTKVPAEDLQTAARSRSAQPSATTSKVENAFCLDDLVVAPVVRERLDAFISATQNRRTVYDNWGMSRRMGAARGLSAMFTGSSGTGKSMAASAIAKALGLDLFRVELSGVVSKYIGETEKNLDAAFEAARASNCVLFFDEADALFGKRSEVKDAHDRYANIECAYLLQKMEQHDGIVILTTNMPRGLDAAFSRRIQFVIDFPRPDAKLRRALWEGMFTRTTPLAQDVDFAFLARNFDVSGGEIRNIVLDAALDAASKAGSEISMDRLLAAVERQLVKQGRASTGVSYRKKSRPLNVAAE
ncbi:MAG: ATP-binding protein [Boseongicola sp.]